MASFDHTLPAGPVAVGDARKHVRDRLPKTSPPETVADIELLTTELVSNAVRHAHVGENGTIGLNIDIGPRIFRVSVIDGGPGFDFTKIVLTPGPDEGGGWGLFLVAELSDRWGIEKGPHGVWFEFDRDKGKEEAIESLRNHLLD